MNTSQLLHRIARKLGVTLRVPSSETQKLEAIDRAVSPLTAAAPTVSSLGFTAGLTNDTFVLTFSEPVNLSPVSSPGTVSVLTVDQGSGAEEQSAVTVTQTGPSEVTITALTTAYDTPSHVAVRFAADSVFVTSAATGARAKTGTDGILVLSGV